MLPLITRFRDHGEDRLDPELDALFAPARRRLDPDETMLRRAEARLSSELDRPAPQPLGGLRRRLAYASAGGGALWASVLGTAAAHKAVAVAVGLGLLLSGGVAAETTGVGPSVRETLGIEQHDAPPDGTPTQVGTGTATSTSTASTTSTPGASATAGITATEGPPTNAIGRFLVQATLVGATDDMLTLEVEGEEVPVALAGVESLQLPGPPSDVGVGAAKLLEPYAGHEVVAQGTCDDPAAVDWSTCVVNRLQVLAGPATKGPPEGTPAGTEPPGLGNPPGSATPGAANEGAGSSESGGGNGVGSGGGGSPAQGETPPGQGQGPDGTGPPGQQGQGEALNGPPEHSSVGGSAASGSAGSGQGQGQGQGQQGNGGGQP